MVSLLDFDIPLLFDPKDFLEYDLRCLFHLGYYPVDKKLKSIF